MNVIKKYYLYRFFLFPVICLIVLLGYGLYDTGSGGFPLKNISHHYPKYQLTISKLNDIPPKIYLIINTRSTRFMRNMLFRDRISVMINVFYTRDLFVSQFAKMDPRRRSTHEFEVFNNNPVKYSIPAMEAELGVKYEAFEELFKLMRSLDIEVINRTDGVVELTDEAPIYSPSLDWYEGYLFYPGPKATLPAENNYEYLRPVQTNWYQFKKYVEKR